MQVRSLLDTDSKQVFKNTLYNLLTQGVLILITIAALKVIVGGISEEKFGLLSLLWVFIGYFTLLDFGVSRAITKFLAESIAQRDEDRSGSVTWSSIYLSAAFGVVLGILLYAVSPFLTRDILKVSSALQTEALGAFRIAAFCLPFILVFGAVRGIFMAAQDFLTSNILQGIIGVLQWVGASILVVEGGSIKDIIGLTLLIRIVMTIVSFFLLPRHLPGILQRYRMWRVSVSAELLRFGGWVTVTQIVSPIIVYLDRFLIGALLSLSAVAYYAIPQEAVARLLTIPLSLSLTLFPVMSGRQAIASRAAQEAMYTRSLRLLFFALIPVVILLIVLSPEILKIWVGSEFSEKSGVVFQILMVGLLFNGLAQIPVTALHAAGRPDLTAKINLIELPFACVLNYLMISTWGITGAAVAWTLRVILDTILLLWATRTYVYPSARSEHKFPRWSRMMLAFSSVLPILFLISTVHNELIKVTLGILFSCGYGVSLWFFGFTEGDRDFLADLRKKFIGEQMR